MPANPSSPSHIFVQALLGETPDQSRVATLDPTWQTLIQAAQAATPDVRRATLLLAKSGQTDLDRLLHALTSPQSPPPPSWPAPSPFGQPRLPQFPDRALPSWIGNIVRSEARSTQTPTDLAGLLSLAVLATACAGRVTVNPWADWHEPLNLFTLVALPPGHRKSAIFASIVLPIQQYEAEAALAVAPQIAAARKARHAAEQALLRAETAADLASDDQRDSLLALAQRRADDLASLDLPVVPRLIVDDCSPERLAMLLHAQGGRLAILSPEGGIFDLIAGRYSTTGAPNLDHVLKGHAGDPIIVDRVGRAGEIIPHPALTIGLTVQPEVLRGLAARPGFHGRGLLARFLYAVPPATLGHRDIAPEPVDDGLRIMYRRYIHALLHHLPSLSLPRLLATPTSSSLATSPAFPLTPAATCPSPSPTLCTCEPETANPLPLSTAVGRGLGGGASSASSLPHHPSPTTQHPPLLLPFSDHAATILRDFARSIEPRLAPTADLAPIVDWASKLVGATARISGLLHLAEHAPDLPEPPAPVSPDAVEAACTIAEYLIAHARAAYDAMGLDPELAHAPVVLTWLQRSGPASFTRRDARRALRAHIRSDHDLDDALDQLEAHGYIRLQPANYTFGRPRSPTYDVHPDLVRP